MSRVMRLSLLKGLCVLFGAATALAESPKEPTWSKDQKAHWSLVPPKATEVPRVKDERWVRNSIDAFILGDMETLGLTPAPEADRATLIRRLRFDLTGLPPSPREVDAFLADDRPEAYERLVDRLLASHEYGERWARFWLDLARFAESDGFKSDVTRPNAWRYRDWVIRALNANLPYNRFLALQLAGDEIAPDDPDALIATGFNRNFPFEDNNKVPGLNRQLMLEDVTDTTASVFMGLTLACARCHDHKYDPLSQRDYYRFQALFAATTSRDDLPLAPPLERALQASVQAEFEARVDRLQRSLASIEQPYLAALLKDRLAKLPPDVRKAFETDPEARTAFQEDLLKARAKDVTVAPSTMRSAMKPEDRRVWTSLGSEMKELSAAQPHPAIGSGMLDTGSKAPPVHLLFKGNMASPGEVVSPGFPSVLADVLPRYEDQPRSQSTGRRAALADWLTRPEHPLTARVMVNRLWQNHFGRGIVATPGDFGIQGSEPTHPELLDWLATQFVTTGWDLKAMHRLMVTSATYRQSCTPSEKTLAEDPENLLFSRMLRRRLEGEAVRDAMLAVSARLDHREGGPSVFPDLPPGVLTRGGWERSASRADRDRRSIYVFVRRNLKYPLFDAFDAPDTNTTCPERNVTVNAPQALMLLNSGLVLEQARSFAGRLLGTVAERHDSRALVSEAYRVALSRSPSDEELTRGVAFLQDQSALLSARTDTPKALDLPDPNPDGHDLALGAALVDYCHVLLNLNEFVFVD
jgi:hypothetical protein